METFFIKQDIRENNLIFHMSICIFWFVKVCSLNADLKIFSFVIFVKSLRVCLLLFTVLFVCFCLQFVGSATGTVRGWAITTLTPTWRTKGRGRRGRNLRSLRHLTAHTAEKVSPHTPPSLLSDWLLTLLRSALISTVSESLAWSSQVVYCLYFFSENRLSALDTSMSKSRVFTVWNLKYYEIL